MPPLAIFGISVGVNFVVRGIIAAQYLWPALRKRTAGSSPAAAPAFFHDLRFIGPAYLVPGVVSPNLPDAFACPAAY